VLEPIAAVAFTWFAKLDTIDWFRTSPLSEMT
jgi:hypothetical protein